MYPIAQGAGKGQIEGEMARSIRNQRLRFFVLVVALALALAPALVIAPAPFALGEADARRSACGRGAGVLQKRIRERAGGGHSAAAKIARRTFYKYFSSKEDVLASIYEIATGELLRAIRDAADSSEKPASSRPKTRGEPLAAVRRAMDAYLDYHVEHATLVRILVEQAIRSDSPLAPLRRRFREDVARLLDDAVFAVTKKRNDPFLYVALLSALEGVSLEMLTADSVLARGDDTRQRVNRAKDVLHRLLDHALSRSM